MYGFVYTYGKVRIMKRRIITLITITTISIALVAGCKGKDKSESSASGNKQSQSAQSNTEAVKAATACAESWLLLVDQGQYAQSWEQTAGLFKQVVPIDQWQNQMKVFRKPLGNLISRKQKSAQYTTTAPGVPDGQYVIIQYETNFEKKASSVETITPMLDEDGVWRISGYFIK